MKYVGAVKRARKTKTGFAFELEYGSASIIFFSSEIVRVCISKSKPGKDKSWAVVQAPPRSVDFSVRSDDHEWALETEALTVRVNRDPFRLMFFDRSFRCLSCDAPWGGAGWRGSRVYCEKSCASDEHFYGFGEKTFPLDRRGIIMEMWNTDHPFHKKGSDPLYISIPFFIGLHSGASYGIFFDNTWKSFFDMRGVSRGGYSFGAEGGDMNYYFIAGPDMKDVVRRYTWLTGTMPLPPRWSAGFHQSRWSYKNETKVAKIASRMRELKIPCDAIHLDIHYMERYKVFTWDENRFPDPARLIGSLADNGFRTITIIDPGVKIEQGYEVYEEGLDGDYFCRQAGGGYFRGFVWPGATVFPDFTREDVREWWAGLVASHISKYGMAGIWNDMNEPSVNILPYKKVTTDGLLHGEHEKPAPHLELRNIYGLAEAMATREGQLTACPERRPFLLTRSGYSGIQRYAAVWSGDNTSAWDQLRLSVPLLCSLGLSGVPFVGADIGGFHGNCTPELFARWIQAGVFYPFCRAHTMLGSRPQEPWSFGARVLKIATEYISLRYSLMPYIYNVLRESAVSGLPAMRAPVLEFPNDVPCHTLEDEFLFGPALLVAPVMEKGAVRREVYLPPGEWIDYQSGERLEGSRKITVSAPLEKLPLFIRSGFIIPSVIPHQYESGRLGDTLTLNVECGADSWLELYEDDGISFNFREGVFSITRFEYHEDDGIGHFAIDPLEKGWNPKRSHYVLKFRGVKTYPEKVLLNGKRVYEAWYETTSGEGPRDGWHYDAGKKTLNVGIADNRRKTSVKIVF